ncbi:MAG: ATP synthase F0 subunit B [Candidatus Electrothrix sp. GW3-4]|uniref:ATP synthase F0 subunit B n=1 Tax=Candidatus Electrothrix sp. GW3-4 TaxID=3126740 RepID=UPI0030CD3A24
MISIDITVLIHIINMIALMFILNKILYKPIIEIIEKRQDELDLLSNDVERYERNAKDRQAEVDRKMREASAKAKDALDAARNQAAKAGVDKLAVVRQKAEGDKEKQLAEVQAEFEETRKELLGSMEVFAQEMASKILGRSLEA